MTYGAVKLACSLFGVMVFISLLTDGASGATSPDLDLARSLVQSNDLDGAARAYETHLETAQPNRHRSS